MAEYIKREDAINGFVRMLKQSGDIYLTDITTMLQSIPPADVRPVVLCRDCKHNYNTCLNHGINEPMCDFTDVKLKESDFCSHGIKRGGDAE